LIPWLKLILEMKNERLYPSRFHYSFCILTLLRINLELIAKKYLGKKRNIVFVDFGCGDAPYRPIFESYADKYISIDLSENKSADLPIDLNGNAPLPDCSADIVLSTQVLEHVLNPKKYLQECHRIIKSKGLLVLSTHGYWKYHPEPGDFWRWTHSGICALIEEAQFKVVESRGIMGLIPVAMHLFQEGVASKIPFIFRSLLFFLIQSFIMCLDKFYSENSKKTNACVYLVVALKIG